jgi:hypothetical protein
MRWVSAQAWCAHLHAAALQNDRGGAHFRAIGIKQSTADLGKPLEHGRLAAHWIYSSSRSLLLFLLLCIIAAASPPQ